MAPVAAAAAASLTPLFLLPASYCPLLTAPQLREVLEKFLDDDSDMKDLNLTAKVGGAASEAFS